MSTSIPFPSLTVISVGVDAIDMARRSPLLASTPIPHLCVLFAEIS